MDRPYEFLSRTGDGVFVVDHEQRIVLWNEAATGLLGFELADTLGRRCYQVLGGTDTAGCVVCRGNCILLQAARRGEAVAARDVCVRTRDGGQVRLNFSTIAFPAGWHELSVLAHLFRRAESPIEKLDPEPVFETSTGPGPRDGAGPGEPVEQLTLREHDVLLLLSSGASTATICTQMGIKVATTRTHVRSILSKFGVRDRLQAVTFAVRAGLVEIRQEASIDQAGREGGQT